MAAYEFGPFEKVKITLSGEVLNLYGPYENLPENIKEVLQLVCHAVCQLQDVIEKAESSVYTMEDIFVAKILDKYLFGDLDEMMAVINVQMLPDSYDIDFFSVKRLAKMQTLIDMAYEHAERIGRVI